MSAEKRPPGRGLIDKLASSHVSGECRGCRGQDVPTFVRTFTNHGDLGPLCTYCIRRLTNGQRRIVVDQCSFCGDSGRVRPAALVKACAYCVTSLHAMVGAQ
jgi:hypothetical protein